MDQTQPLDDSTKLTKRLLPMDNPLRLILTVIVASIILGTLTGYIISSKKTGNLTSSGLTVPAAKNPEQDTQTFRDFAEGTIKARPATEGGEYVEGTHTLERQGAVPVALTSSVVDLSQYEGKKVKVYGETQKAFKEGWLMDVGKVEEIQ